MTNPPPHSRRLYFLWYVYFSLIIHHLEDIGGVKTLGGPKR
jgi:hypothetical protein